MMYKFIKRSLFIYLLAFLGLSLIGCGGGGGSDDPKIENRGDLATLRSNASMKAQPHYQCLDILPTSYIQDNDTEGNPRQQIKGSVKLIYSRYTGKVPDIFKDYEIYKYETSFNLTTVSSNYVINSSSFRLVTELDDGEYYLGSQDPNNQSKIIWGNDPVLSDFKTYEIGETCDINSPSENGSYTVLTKEYVTIGNIRYPAWKVVEIASGEGYEYEDYYWVNPDYGTLKMQCQMAFTDSDDNYVMYLDAVLKENY